MSPFFWTTYSLLWILTFGLTVGVLLLYRQFGLVEMPGRRRMSLGGLDIGAQAPPLALEFLDGSGESGLTWRASENDPGSSSWLLLFSLPGCPICEHMWQEEDLRELPREWGDVNFVWVGAKDLPAGLAPDGWLIANSADRSAHYAMDVPAVPFAYIVSKTGTILSKGLINNSKDLGGILRPKGRRLGNLEITQDA